jgi:hypothetical protein
VKTRVERRTLPNSNGRIVREISIEPHLWAWLKSQPSGASGWINYHAGQARREDENANLKAKLERSRDEAARLRSILNSQGVEPDPFPSD